MSFQRILLSIDGTMPLDGLVRAACGLALNDRAEVVVASTASRIPNYLGESWQHELVKRNHAEAEGRAAAIADELRRAGLVVETVISEGLPADVTLRVAADHACDLIVIGNHLQSDVASLLLGNPCLKVVAHASIPVLVVRA